MSVTTTRPEYDRLLTDVIRNRAAVAGEREIKRATTLFLPPLASQCITTSVINDQMVVIPSCSLTPEGQASYNKYLSMAYFFGATGRTVDGLSGLIFSKDPVREIPSVIEYLKDNVDGTGQTLRGQAQSSVVEALITPQLGLLVDFPNVKQVVSKLQAEQSNLRPKILQYKFESITNWHFDIVNNEQKLTLLVLKESEQINQGNKFEYKTEVRYRVLELIDGVYHQSVWDEGSELSPPEPVLVNGDKSPVIPFFFISVGSENKAIVNDLVDTNLNHYRFFADYAAKEHASAFPIYTEAGVDDVDRDLNGVVGPQVKWTSGSPEAKWGVLQTASDGGSMRQYLLDQEQRMAALGAEMLKPRVASAESAEAKSLDQVAQNSTTANVAINVSEGYQKALQFAALWLGSTEEVVYQLNTDYNPAGMSPQAQLALFSQLQGGAISYQTYFISMQKGEIIGADVKMEDELKRISEDNLESDI